MNLAAKHNIEVSLRPTDTVVLTIVNIEERQVRNADGSTMNADVLIGPGADNGTRYTVRLNNVTAGQLVRLFGPEDRRHGQQAGADEPFTKGDKSYVSFANAPARFEVRARRNSDGRGGELGSARPDSETDRRRGNVSLPQANSILQTSERGHSDVREASDHRQPGSRA